VSPYQGNFWPDTQYFWNRALTRLILCIYYYDPHSEAMNYLLVPQMKLSDRRLQAVQKHCLACVAGRLMTWDKYMP